MHETGNSNHQLANARRAGTPAPVELQASSYRHLGRELLARIVDQQPGLLDDSEPLGLAAQRAMARARHMSGQRGAEWTIESKPASPQSHQLIESCQGLVRSLAWKIHRKLPSHVDLEELIAYGDFGLTQAAEDFDESLGNRFITYAHHRIRGAIFDGLSQMSWFSRQDYHRSRYEHMANDFLRMYGEDGSPEALGDMDRQLRWMRDLGSSLVVVHLACGEEDDTGPQPAADEDEIEPPLRSMEQELRQKLRQLIDELPDEAGTLIRSAYYEGMTLQEAGRRLGISKAWASRLHAKTLQRLAQSLRTAGVAD